jgi:uncharacterized protein YjiS (DUF1127 family)
VTCIAEAPVPIGRAAALYAWIRTVLVRPRQDRCRRLARIELTSFSRHMLKDIGLADRDVA